MADHPDDDLIALIYEAAFAGELWPSVLDQIAERINARHIFLGIHDIARGAESIAPRTDPDHLRDYNEHWVEKNPCVAAMISAPVGRVFHTPGEVSDGEAYRRSEIYNEWCRPGDMGYGAMCVALDRDLRQHAFAAAYKSWGIDCFEPDEQARYTGLVRHIGRAVDLQRRVLDLRGRHEAALGAIALLDEGLLVVDSALRIHFAGGAAADILDGLGTRVELGASLVIPGYSALLADLVSSCLNPGAGRTTGGSFAVPRAGRQALRLSVMPFPSNRLSQLGLDPQSQPAAVVLVDDPELRIRRAGERIGLLYGFTPAELRLALEIARGDGRRRAAERCGISDTTARAHLSSIFEKTGVHRQAELVRLLIGG